MPGTEPADSARALRWLAFFSVLLGFSTTTLSCSENR